MATLAEHGFSLWVEADDKEILFDTGQGPALRHNAQAMHVDLNQAELLILCHGHYDHTGGLPDVLGRHTKFIFIAMLTRTEQGLVVCIWCCHAGIINTLQYIMELTGEKRIHTLIGGLHLLSAQEEQLKKVISELQQFDKGPLVFDFLQPMAIPEKIVIDPQRIVE